MRVKKKGMAESPLSECCTDAIGRWGKNIVNPPGKYNECFLYSNSARNFVFEKMPCRGRKASICELFPFKMEHLHRNAA